jgi:periplasmic divalent cation tolerance protein
MSTTEELAMTHGTEVIYIFWTCRSTQEAKKIIHRLLELRLIACASLFPQIESIYRWEGKIEESLEVKVILKTAAKHFAAVQHTIQTDCSYEVPEILQVDIAQGNPHYLSWIVQETAPLLRNSDRADD